MKKKLCVLLSAGLDSFTAYQWLRKQENLDTLRAIDGEDNWNFEDDILFLQIIDTDSPYYLKEINIMDNLYGLSAGNIKKIRIHGYGKLVQGNHVVLGRNAVYASMAAGIAPIIWLCGTAFEDNNGMYDKNNEFFEQMTEALSYACLYSRETDTTVYSPFQESNDSLLPIIGIWD